LRRLSAALIAAYVLVHGAAAQDFPSRPITLVVPFPPGGNVDAVARVVADKLSAALGQPVTVDNRGGGAGNIGARAVAKSPPDGTVLLLGNAGVTSINPSLYGNPGYDIRKDFVAVGLIATSPLVVMAHPSVAAKTIPELIALAKASPGKLNLGTPAIGSAGYLSAELFKASAGIDMTTVAYKGTAPLTNDLLGGHVQAGFNTIPPTLGNIKANNLRALAVTTPTRSALLPEVPTLVEAGLPDSVATLYFGMLAPAGTPAAVVMRLNTELRAIVALPEVQARIAADGGDAAPSSPDEYAAIIDLEEAKWGALIKRLGLKAD
jgi:tripartite-type tricarboxylate transporter receptor subunit TctC